MSLDPKIALARTVLLVQEELFPEASDDQILEALTKLRIRLRADRGALTTPAGQSALVGSFIACAELGAELVLDCPDVALVSPQPPLRAGTLLAGLYELGADLIRPVGTGAQPVDLEVCLGASVPASSAPDERLRLSVGNLSYRLEKCGPAESRAAANASGEEPFGAILGAVAVAAEAFRIAMVNLASALGQDPPGHHPITSFQSSQLALNPITKPGPFTVDFVSAGAITQAAMFALGRIPAREIAARVFDSDLAEASNLNRYPLLRASHLGQSKPDLLRGALAGTSITIEAHSRRFDSELVDQILPLAPLVAVGVDDIPSRWFVQRLDPDWLGVGSTGGAMCVVSEHVPEGPCAGCLHPREDEREGEIATVSFVSLLAGALLAYRLVAAATGHGDPSATVAYPLALSGSAGLMTVALSATSECPVSCPAARALGEG